MYGYLVAPLESLLRQPIYLVSATPNVTSASVSSLGGPHFPKANSDYVCELSWDITYKTRDRVSGQFLPLRIRTASFMMPSIRRIYPLLVYVHA
jgi:hypothetical protein